MRKSVVSKVPIMSKSYVVHSRGVVATSKPIRVFMASSSFNTLVLSVAAAF